MHSQNLPLKKDINIAPSKKTLELTYKLLTQKIHYQYFPRKRDINTAPSWIHYQNCSLKKFVIQIAVSKEALSKQLPQKIHDQNCSLNEYTIKIALSKQNIT